MCCDRITSLAGAEGSEHSSHVDPCAGHRRRSGCPDLLRNLHDLVAHTQVAAGPSDSIDELSSHHGKF
jgi:hypothetical protein